MMKSRFLSVMLTVAMLCMFASCGEASAVQTDTTETDTAVETSPDNIPLGTDLGGKTVRIYTRGDTNDSEFDSEQTGDIVSDAIYERNRTIEDRLNVTLEYSYNTSADFWGDRNIYMDTVRSSVMANDGSIDIAAGLSNIMPYLAQDGMFVNLLSDKVPYVDFDSPWWPSALVNELAVQDRMYFTSGEICLGVIKGMMCYYFNKSMQEQFKLENPYELVSSGKWTLDKFDEMAKSVYQDLNGNTTVDVGDRFGFVIANENHAPNFVLACGLRLTSFGADGRPYYDLGTESIINVIEKMNNIMKQDGFVAKFDNDSTYANLFINNEVLFTTGEFQFAETYRDLDFDFGILPFPKYSEEQEDYVSSCRATYSMLGITVTADLESAAAVLEASASENYRTVTPAYFEKALKVKYARDDISSQMFDLIKGHISFDFGVVHGPMMEGITTKLRSEICRINGTWASTWASSKDAIDVNVTNYLDELLALPE